MWAECSIPLAAVEASHLKLETNRNGKTPYGRLKYSDQLLQLDPFTIVTPAFPILKYDNVKGRVDLDLAADPASLTKFETIQDALISLLQQQQYEWFHSNTLTHEDVRAQFQPFLQGTVLSIYLSTLLRSAKPICVWNGTGWSNQLTQSTFPNGKSIRLILRLTGIQSFQISSDPSPRSLKCHIVMHPIAVLLRP